jgi:hypothetical protein
VIFPFQKNPVPPAEAKLNGVVGTRATASVVVVPFRLTVVPEVFQPNPTILELPHTAAFPLDSIWPIEVYAVLATLFARKNDPFALISGAFPG